MTKKERKEAFNREERARMNGEKIEEPLKVCGNCLFWIRHYTGGPGMTYAPVPCGHCHQPRLKHRKPWDTCERFKIRRIRDMSEAELKEAFRKELEADRFNPYKR